MATLVAQQPINNEFVMIKGRPCKVLEKIVTCTGKHGHSKIHLIASDMFTNQKIEDICLSSDLPMVNCKEYQLSSINEDGSVTMIDLETGKTKTDVLLPQGELGDQIKKTGNGILVSVLSACGEEAIFG